MENEKQKSKEKFIIHVSLIVKLCLEQTPKPLLFLCSQVRGTFKVKLLVNA
jgi:hypothetical protein